MRTSRVLALGLALAWAALPAATAVAADADGPRAVVDATTTAVVDILKQRELASADRRQRIEQVVYANVDFDTLSRLVLARNWNRLKPDQQAAFTEEFKKHLSVTYGSNVDRYRDQRVVITGAREETRGDWTVQTKIVRGPGEDVAVDYRLRQRDGQWRIIDVIIEGVSLVANFRSQFQEIMASGGPERLLKLLREKNERGEPLRTAPAST